MQNRVANIDTESENRANFNRKPITANDFGSPRFMRKKQDFFMDGKTIHQKNNDKIRDNNAALCYISPKKILEHPNGGSDSTRSIKSTSGFMNNSVTQKNTNLSNQYTMSAHNLKNPEVSRQSETAKQMVVKTKTLSQQNYELNKTIQKLKRKLSQKQNELQKLNEQNMELTEKLIQMDGIVFNKNTVLQKLEQMLAQKNDELEKYRQMLKQTKDHSSDLQCIIDNMNKNLEQSFRYSCINASSETQDDQKQKLEKQLSRYKTENFALNSKLKYVNLQECMYKKLKFDHQNQCEKNQILRKQNKKLLFKIQSLVKQAENRSSYRYFNIQQQKKTKTMRDSEISLNLTPEKQDKQKN